MLGVIDKFEFRTRNQLFMLNERHGVISSLLLIVCADDLSRIHGQHDFSDDRVLTARTLRRVSPI